MVSFTEVHFISDASTSRSNKEYALLIDDHHHNPAAEEERIEGYKDRSSIDSSIMKVSLDLTRYSSEKFEVVEFPPSSPFREEIYRKLQEMDSSTDDILKESLISALKDKQSGEFNDFLYATSLPAILTDVVESSKSGSSMYLKFVCTKSNGLTPRLMLLSHHLESLRANGNISSVFTECKSDDKETLKLMQRAGFQSSIVVDASTKQVVDATTWRFNPISKKPRIENNDDNKLIYFNLDLLDQEAYASPSDWNPGSVLVIERGALAKQRSNDSTPLKNILVCTAPEPWEMVRKYFLDRISKEEKCHVYMVTSMEEKKVFKDIDEYLAKGIQEVYGIGGGSACDFAKIASERLDCTLYLVPSVLSVDAPFTRKAGVRVVTAGRTGVRYISDACRLKQLIVDAELLAQAPKVLNTGGVGDILSIITALWDWREAHTNQGECYDVDISQKSLHIVNKLLSACSELENTTDEGYKILAECFLEEVLLCEQYGNSRPEEGSEHYLAYAIESSTGRGYIHGRLVGLCIIITRLLQHVASSRQNNMITDDDQKLSDILNSCEVSKTLAKFYKKIGLYVIPGSDGMPTREEVVYALQNMESFLKLESQLLPGYFHFYGAPSKDLIESTLDCTFQLLQ